MAITALLCGCSAGSHKNASSAPSTDESTDSSLPFDDYYPDIQPDTPVLTYLGRRDLKGSDALSLYKKTFAADYSESETLIREYCSEYRLADALSEKISSDRSPDLTDKLPNSYPYLISKNYYEDLTKYLDRSAPQWEEYAPYIDYYSYGENHFFYPETVTAVPRFLVYCKERFSTLGITDPEQLFYENKWTRTEFINAAKTFCGAMGGVGVYGDYITDSFISAAGETVFAKSENGQLVCNLNSEKITEVFDFLKNELSANMNTENFTGYDKIINGRAAFLLVDEEGYEELLKIDSWKTYGAVPVPKSDESEIYYCAASCDGFLVPKGAKNVKGAACFINCGRIVAQQKENEETADVLGKMRENELIAVPEENYCFDEKTNAAIAAYLNSPLSGESEQPADTLAIEKAISEINSLH
ncbi:MAG: extracellular solute-binding protein [Oscillospiraceae bacterium]|nr:extracellular solute-binding protein [Oscillospiraceae bacterium]